MAKFRANTDDAYILTNIQNQESGDSDWAKYQVVTKDKSRLILHNNTTNSLLKVNKYGYATQVHDVFNDGSAVATYTFDGNANDLGGNYNGTWSGTEQYDTGVFGQSAKFDGNSVIVIDFGFKLQCPFVYTGWFKPNKTGSTQQVVFGWDYSGVSSSSEFDYHFITDDEGNTWSLNTGAHGSENKTPSIQVPDNTWVFFYVEFKSSGTRLILKDISGNLLGDVSKSVSITQSMSTKVALGAWIYDINASGFYNYFDGLIDQLRIFNRALTEDEVTFLYHEGLTHIRKHDQLIIYNATDGAKIHEVNTITYNDTDKTYDIDISSLSLTEAPTNAHQLTKSVDLTDKIDTSTTTATTLVLQDALENPTLVKNGETLVIDGYKLENINVTRSLYGGSVKYIVDISELNFSLVPSEVVLIKPRVEISVGDEDKANADDLVLDILDSTTASITVGYYEGSKRTRIKNAEKIDTDTGLDLSLIEVVEEYLDPTKVDPFNDGSEVAFYQLDGNANDAHNQYNGIWSGTEQYDTGVFGQAAKFDGNSTISCGTFNFNSNTGVAFTMWVQVLESSDGRGTWFECYNGLSNLTFGGSTPAQDYGIWISGGGGEYFWTSYFKGKGIWSFYILNILNDGSLYLYIDSNTKLNTGLTLSNFSDVDVHISWNNNGASYYGKDILIDQVRIFNRALTENEVKYLYNEGKYKFNLNLQSEQSSAPTKAIIRPTIQDILELDPNNTAYDNTNDLVSVYYQPIQKGNGFRSVQVKWNAHRQGDENNSLRVNLWKKVA